jgi:hypothetical protein
MQSLLLKVAKRFRKLILNNNHNEGYSISDTFLASSYQKHNVKRLAHLDSLGFDFSSKRVIEFGAGIGDHTYYFLIKGARILPTEGRSELVELISNRFGLDVKKIDMEIDLPLLSELGYFDFAYCYGVLYHIKNPASAIEAISKIADTLLLETAVSAEDSEYGPNVIFEPKENPTQANSGLGCRPNRKWLFDTLKLHYSYVYMPSTVPEHIEFPKNWDDFTASNNRDQIQRSIYIASKKPILNEKLLDKYLTKFD